MTTMNRLNFRQARNKMADGGIMIRQKGKRERYFVEPGGEINKRVFMTLRLIPNVIPNKDGSTPLDHQSWRWVQ